MRSGGVPPWRTSSSAGFDPDYPLGDSEKLFARLPVCLCPPAGEQLLRLFRRLCTSLDGTEALHFRNQPIALSQYAFDTLPLARVPPG
jgi:hypothetical protein